MQRAHAGAALSYGYVRPGVPFKTENLTSYTK